MNPEGIREWVIDNIVVLILMGIGVIILAGAKKGNYSGMFATYGIIIGGLLLIVGPAAFVALGGDLSGIITGGGKGN